MRAQRVIRAGGWPGDNAADGVTLDYDRRHRRRLALTTDGGRNLLLDLAEATHLRDGDGLDCGDEGIVRVIAAPESLIGIAAPPALLIRIAWHLGNRHLDVAFQLGDECGSLLIRDDHVIGDMVRRLGAMVTPVTAPFDPESGAYDGHHH